MEIRHPSWDAKENAYLFEFTGTNVLGLHGKVIQDISAVSLPDVPTGGLNQFLQSFLEGTKRYFVTPLEIEKVKKHLRHTIGNVPPLPSGVEFAEPLWKPTALKMKSNEFCLYWSVIEWKAAEALIQSDFFRPKSPAPPPSEPNLRTIHIQNTMDSLVPVNDIPLSDLPPLNFGEDNAEKREVRRRIREARLKVELAKLKAKRMAQHYIERYGEDTFQSEDSSLESSESESDGNLGRYSYP
jgi:hypothetical protein